jgi:hypothetical protein
MADLTADAYIKIEGGAKNAVTEKWVLTTSSAQTIYKGQPMYLDISADTVYVLGFLDAQTVAADDIFIGIAYEGKTVASGATENTEITILIEPTIVGFPGSVFTDADVGDTMYMSDSATLSATAGDNPEIGKLKRVRDGYQYVRLVSPKICTGA